MDYTLPRSHRCHLCHRRYKRSEHLKRHLASHGSNQGQHSCTACGRGFSRSDSLKRHVRTCAARNVDMIRVPKRRACDHCVRAKKACDFQFPCRTCLDRGMQCSYAVWNDKNSASEEAFINFSTNIASQLYDTFPAELFEGTFWTDTTSDLFDLASTSWNDFLSLLPASDAPLGGNNPNLPFLDNFTKYTGLIKSFDCGSSEMRQLVLEHAIDQSRLQISPFQYLQSKHTEILDPLALLCQEIVALIKEVAMIKPRNSPVDVVWSTELQHMCARFFDPSEVRKHIEVYWSIWHPNVNIIHRPTFDVVCAKPTLIAAMAVMGATLSPRETDMKRAQIWFNAVEEIVFIDDDFCDDISAQPCQFPAPSKIQAMQAAYIVCLYQNWEGTDQSKRRIRRHRFSTLVSVARDIGIRNAMHVEHTTLDRFDWSSFAAHEQLIRVFLWIFLLDTAFVIFNNLPPRMVIKEMTMDMASCEAIFQAETRESCFFLIEHKTKSTIIGSLWRPPSLCRTAEMLCVDELDDLSLGKLADLGPLNLFAVASSLHSMLFHYQNSFNSESQLVPLRNALENWKAVWARYMRDCAQSPDHAPLATTTLTAENMWKRVGFMRYASEYWLLASLLLDRICIAERYAVSAKQEDTQCMVGNLEAGSEQTLNPVLQRYDETSMQQVNDLIADLQRTRIT